jgi:N-acetyl-gamma-glutamylphosphate reductase
MILSTGLPDAASMEAAGFVEPDNDRTVIVDASTAFRVDDDWVYGFPGNGMERCLLLWC